MPDGSVTPKIPESLTNLDWLRWHAAVPPLSVANLSDAEREITAGKTAILFNGPPRCGKDSVVRDFLGRYNSMARRGMADHLKESTHAIYGLFDEAGRPLPFDAFEAVKDQPRPEFGGLTPRHAYIVTSEWHMKPFHGSDSYGIFWLKRIAKMPDPIILVPDAGFAAEWSPVIQSLGADNMLLIRIHAEERGITFTDSRSYINLPGVETHDVGNQIVGNTTAFYEECRSIVTGFLTRQFQRGAPSAG